MMETKDFEGHTPGPWRWQGEDYRGGWGWQMLVGPNGEGLIVGQDPHGGMSKQLCAYQPLDPAICITGIAAHGKEHAEPVHVYGEANARLIASAPRLLSVNKQLVEALELLFVDDLLDEPQGDNFMWREEVQLRLSMARAAIQAARASS